MLIKCSHTDVVDIDTLVPHPRNPNHHSEKQIKHLAKILKHQGWRHPITVSNRSGYVVAGHGRIAAARLNGWQQGPIDRQDFANEADEYAHMIADNKIAELADLDLTMVNEDALKLGEGFDFDLLGIPDFEPVKVEHLDPGCDDDDIPGRAPEPICKTGDVWVLGRHRLVCGDSTNILDVEKLLGGEKADMVLTDPPYGISVVAKSGTVGGGNVAKPGVYSQVIGDDTTDTAEAVYNLCVGLEIPIICLWGGNYYSKFCPPSSGWLVWDKRGDMASNNFADCELAWTNKKMPARCYKQTWAGMIKEGESGKRVHPTQKPVQLSVWAMGVLSAKAKNILDLFGGSGSTLIACEKDNRRCFMLEMDPKYCDVIITRWEKYTGKIATRLIEP